MAVAKWIEVWADSDRALYETSYAPGQHHVNHVSSVAFQFAAFGGAPSASAATCAAAVIPETLHGAFE